MGQLFPQADPLGRDRQIVSVRGQLPRSTEGCQNEGCQNEVPEKVPEKVPEIGGRGGLRFPEEEAAVQMTFSSDFFE